MGLIRKTASISTGGAVKFTSKREAQTKAALEQAKLAKAERKALKANVKTLKASAKAEADEGKPWYLQSTVGGVIQKVRSDRADDVAAEAAVVADDPTEAIRKLAELHEQGILTDEEFATKKAELLERL